MHIAEICILYVKKDDYRERLYEKSSQEQSEEESKERISGAYENQRWTRDIEKKEASGTYG